METKKILVKNILDNSKNPRSEIGDTTDLEASIKAHGLISPITVRWNVTACKYEVVAGSRRLAAMKKIGAESIDCIVNGSDDDDELFAISTAENIVRKELSPVEECRAIKTMVDGGKDIRSVATTFGHTVRWAMGRLKMAELGEDIMQSVENGDITLAHAEVLTMCSNDDEVKKFADQCRYTLPEDLKKRIMNEKKNLSKAPFDVKKLCAGCKKQTICQQDIFGDITDSYCEDGECFQAKLDAYIEKKRESLKKAGYKEYEGNWGWGFKNSNDYIDPDNMDEEDTETVERIKAEGGCMLFMLDDDGTVTFRWDRSDDPGEEIENETQEQERAKYEMNGKVHQRTKELEKADFRERVDFLVNSIGIDAVALLFDVFNRERDDYHCFGECCTVDDDDEYYEGAVANINEATDKGITQRDYIVDSIVDILTSYDGVIYKSEAERAFFSLKPHEEYERQARELIENEPEEEAEEGEEE